VSKAVTQNCDRPEVVILRAAIAESQDIYNVDSATSLYSTQNDVQGSDLLPQILSSLGLVGGFLLTLLDLCQHKQCRGDVR
jgi:hypothetical protein